MAPLKEILSENTVRAEGLIGSVITGLAGLTIFLPDHKLAQQSYADPIAGHVFDVFGAMWAMQMFKLITNRDDLVGETVIAFVSAIGLETLQYFHLAFGDASFIGDGIAAPAVGVALTASISAISKLLDRLYQSPIVSEIYNRCHVTHLPTRPFLGTDFPFTPRCARVK